jgi:hypothetical protein
MATSSGPPGIGQGYSILSGLRNTTSARIPDAASPMAVTTSANCPQSDVEMVNGCRGRCRHGRAHRNRQQSSGSSNCPICPTAFRRFCDEKRNAGVDIENSHNAKAGHRSIRGGAGGSIGSERRYYSDGDRRGHAERQCASDQQDAAWERRRPPAFGRRDSAAERRPSRSPDEPKYSSN